MNPPSSDFHPLPGFLLPYSSVLSPFLTSAAPRRGYAPTYVSAWAPLAREPNLTSLTYMLISC